MGSHKKEHRRKVWHQTLASASLYSILKSVCRKISAGEQVVLTDSLLDAIKTVHVIICALPNYGGVEEAFMEDESLLRMMYPICILLCYYYYYYYYFL